MPEKKTEGDRSFLPKGYICPITTYEMVNILKYLLDEFRKLQRLADSTKALDEIVIWIHYHQKHYPLLFKKSARYLGVKRRTLLKIILSKIRSTK